jgi:hypothetical protein
LGVASAGVASQGGGHGQRATQMAKDFYFFLKKLYFKERERRKALLMSGEGRGREKINKSKFFIFLIISFVEDL